MQPATKIPITAHGLTKRVKRHLAKRGEQLVRREGRVWRVAGGAALEVESIEALARELGCFADHEEVVS